MPTPNTGESESQFISRCMGDSEAQRTFPEEDQRLAFCYAKWEEGEKQNVERKNEHTK